MLIARSMWRKALVTLVAAAAFVSLYEVTMLDSRRASRQAERRGATARPIPGARLTFTATAYCKGSVTASGVAPRSGIAAADPDFLPVGSVVQLDSVETQYSGIYTILDTGPKVQGRRLDIYMWSCHEALRFGRRPVQLIVLRLGWSPKETTPHLMDEKAKLKS